MRSLFLEPGRLRMLVSLQAPQRTGDGLGGSAVQWSEIASVFALVEPLTAKSLQIADGSIQSVTHRIWVRHRSDAAPGMRLVFKGRPLAVEAVHDPDGSGRYTIILAREETP